MKKGLKRAKPTGKPAPGMRATAARFGTLKFTRGATKARQLPVGRTLPSLPPVPASERGPYDGNTAFHLYLNEIAQTPLLTPAVLWLVAAAGGIATSRQSSGDSSAGNR